MANKSVENKNIMPKFVENSGTITPKDSSVVKHSLYKSPIEKLEGLARGESRRWGDASVETKRESMRALLDESMKRGLSRSEASFVLSVSYVESGFNPDAAASTTSAGGLGQFVNNTAKACGVEGMGKFDLKEGAEATVRYLKNIYDGVVKRNEGMNQDDLFVETYGRFHDGGIVSEDTRENLARKRILPLVSEFEGYIDELEEAGELDYQPKLDETVLQEDRDYKRMGCLL